MAQLGMVAVMATMAEDVPALPVPAAVVGIASFLDRYHERLNDEQAAALMLLGAGLWRRGAELGDIVPEIDEMLASRQ